MRSNTVSGLARKRRELTCEINRLAEQHAGLLVQLEALDQVLVMLDPGMRPEEIPALRIVSQPTWARKGEVTRLVLSVLRQSNAPLSAEEIARRVAEARGEATSARAKKSVYKVLEQHRQRGSVRSIDGGPALLWEVVR